MASDKVSSDLLLARPFAVIRPSHHKEVCWLFETPLYDCSATSDGGTLVRVKYWEIVTDNLSKAGWSLGWVSALDVEGRTIWIADVHRG